MGIIWTIIIGFIAGVVAKFIMPRDNEPSGFILTTILGIVGAFVATYHRGAATTAVLAMNSPRLFTRLRRQLTAATHVA